MSGISNSTSPAFLPFSLQTLPMQAKPGHFALKKVISSNVFEAANVFETAASNDEPLSKKRKIESADSNSVPLASIESTISHIGNDALAIQQNPTEHLSSPFTQQSTSNNSNESDTSPQKLQKPKFTDKERQEMIETKNYYEELLKKGGNTAKQKNDFKLLLYKYKKKIAEDANLVLQENFHDFKVQSGSELNKTKEQYQKMIDDVINKNHDIENIYTKKVSSLEDLHNKKVSSLNDAHEKEIQELQKEIKHSIKSNNFDKIEEQRLKIMDLESEVEKKVHQIKTLKSRLTMTQKKLSDERKKHHNIEKYDHLDLEKYKQAIETKENVLKMVERERATLKKDIASLEEEKNAFRSKETDLTQQCQSLQGALEEEKKETISLKRKLDEVTENSKAEHSKFEEIQTIFFDFTLKLEKAIVPSDQ
jgi:chromosome segregation ATPase